MKRYALPISLFSFICWIIVQADTDQDNVLISWASAVPNGDKIGHILLFGTLALLLNISLNFSQTKLLGLKLHWGSLVVFIFALAEEVSQGFFASRNQDINDVIADLIGIFIFTFAWKKIAEKIKRSRNHRPLDPS
jgi:VanZ family protein